MEAVLNLTTIMHLLEQQVCVQAQVWFSLCTCLITVTIEFDGLVLKV